jgi:hypothetical protein
MKRREVMWPESNEGMEDVARRRSLTEDRGQSDEKMNDEREQKKEADGVTSQKTPFFIFMYIQI